MLIHTVLYECSPLNLNPWREGRYSVSNVFVKVTWGRKSFASGLSQDNLGQFQDFLVEFFQERS